MALDLSSCDREQVQFSGAIQPHGVLIVLDERLRTVSHASRNTLSSLGVDVTQIINRDLASAIPPAEARFVYRRLFDTSPGCVPVHLGSIEVNDAIWQVFAHRLDGRTVLELEPAVKQNLPSTALYSEVRSCISGLHAANGVEQSLSVAVSSIRALTGCDRVLAYQFLEDGTGHILAEARRQDLKSFVGLHFPPGDVPAPARRILSLVWVRHQPDIAYTEVPVVSSDPSAPPLDLSYSMLRSTAAQCNRYYLNLGVRSKMVIALLHQGEMWGAVICQHETSREIAYETRLGCETIAHSLSLSIGDKAKASDARETAQSRQTLDALIQQLSMAPSWAVPLAEGILNLVPSTGAAIVVDGGILLRGATPPEEQVLQLAQWLETRRAGENDFLYSSRCLPARFAPAQEWRSLASGILAVWLGSSEYLMWFRPETAYEVSWAGDPRKPVEVDEQNGQIRLSPRTSFEMQRAPLSGLSESWKPHEREAALALRWAVVTARRAETLALQVKELTASKEQLESFAYIASHDLRTPLRGINMTSEFLAEDLRDVIGAAESAQLETIRRLSTRMDELLQSLLNYSRLGATRLERRWTDMNTLLAQASETLAHMLDSSASQLRVPRPLPRVICDPVQIQAVLTNLIQNGLKYNTSNPKIVEVGFRDGAEPVFYVQDNGIGIAPEDQENVFVIFKRLHGRDEFGGGTGAGLTIVKKTIENHGGKIWIESSLGNGSTFCFTLPPK